MKQVPLIRRGRVVGYVQENYLKDFVNDNKLDHCKELDLDRLF